MTADDRLRNTPNDEPPLLRRLRKAVRASGLHVDLGGLPSDERAVVVTNRLAQTTVRYLTSIEPVLGQRLSEELRDLTSPAEHDLLLHDRSFTFYHVVQFLYEWAKHYSASSDRRYFCYGMGVGGGGVEVEPNTEVISLLQMLLTAMPAAEDEANLGSVMACMGPLVVGKIFSGDLFRLECALSGPLRAFSVARVFGPGRVALESGSARSAGRRRSVSFQHGAPCARHDTVGLEYLCR